MLIVSSAALAACSSTTSPANLPSCGAQGTQLTLGVGSYTSIDPATDSGCVTIAANASTTDSAEYLVLPWSAGGVDGGAPTVSAPFALQSAEPAAAARMPSFASFNAAARGARGAAAVAFDHALRQLGHSRRYSLIAPSEGAANTGVPQRVAAAGPPTLGSVRKFKVCNNATCTATTDVGAKVQSVGVHIAIYVDTLAPSPGLSTSDFDQMKQLFDTRLYPLDTVTFGHISDIDSNTVVIVLMTGQVNKLVSKATCRNSGYIAGFFFPGDLDPNPAVAAQFNNGEVFYSIVADSTGTLSCAHKPSEVKDVTPVTFTHEFQHMINFAEHVLVRNGSNSEDGWLDEGLSKYAEEIAGRSFLPSDSASFSQFAIGDVFDAYQYMLAPGSTPLIIPADTGTLAMVGASWLFTRYIVDQFGDSLPAKLVQTTQFGTGNVAAQTGQPFAQTATRWGLTNWVSDLPNFTPPPELKYSLWHFRRTFSSLHAQDAADFPLDFPLVPIVAAGSGVNVSGTLWSGSGVYVRAMQAPSGAAFTLRFSAPGGGAISTAVVPRLVVLRIR